MRKALTLVAAAAICLTALANEPTTTPESERIAVVEAGDTLRLSVPVSRVIMTIPRSGLTLVPSLAGGATSNPRYFHLEDPARGLAISGWFEPARLYSGLKKLWKRETEAWRKQGLPKPSNESFVKVGKWEAVLYDIELTGISNTHARAQWVELGTWIDVHISVTTVDPIDVARASVMDVLKSIQVASAP
jgi:hypothetical protein